MDKRIFFVILIVALFWVAPSPSSTQARVNRKVEPVRVMSETPKISIKPYVRPIQGAK